MERTNAIKKIIFMILILFIMFSISGQAIYASSIGSVIEGADDFIQKGQEKEQISSENLKNLSGPMYNVLLAIGTVIAVIIGLILGIQFMTGSVEQKSKVKESLIPYIAGCVVIFGAFGIWKLVVTILQNV